MYQKLIDDLRLTAEAGQTSYIIKEKKRKKNRICNKFGQQGPGWSNSFDNKYYKFVFGKIRNDEQKAQ